MLAIIYEHIKANQSQMKYVNPPYFYLITIVTIDALDPQIKVYQLLILVSS